MDGEAFKGPFVLASGPAGPGRLHFLPLWERMDGSVWVCVSVDSARLLFCFRSPGWAPAGPRPSRELKDNNRVSVCLWSGGVIAAGQRQGRDHELPRRVPVSFPYFCLTSFFLLAPHSLPRRLLCGHNRLGLRATRSWEQRGGAAQTIATRQNKPTS